jgi:hypothetical protein
MELDRTELPEIRYAIHRTIVRERDLFEQGRSLGIRLARVEKIYAKIKAEIERLDAIDQPAD